MNRLRFGVALAVVGLLVTAAAAGADVKSTSKSQMKFEGALGRVMGMFGGKAVKEGVVSTVAVKGDRKITTTGDTAEIVDLAEEKVYELNLKDKSYKVVTFAEMRKQMEEARAKMEEEARKQRAAEGKKDPNAKEMEIEFSAKETGQRRQINGFDCRQVVMTVAMHEKGKTLDEAGGMLITFDSWLAPEDRGDERGHGLRHALLEEDGARCRPAFGRGHGAGLRDVPRAQGRAWPGSRRRRSTWTARPSRPSRRCSRSRPRSRPHRRSRTTSRAARRRADSAACSGGSARRRKSRSRPTRSPRRLLTATRG